MDDWGRETRIPQCFTPPLAVSLGQCHFKRCVVPYWVEPSRGPGIVVAGRIRPVVLGERERETPGLVRSTAWHFWQHLWQKGQRTGDGLACGNFWGLAATPQRCQIKTKTLVGGCIHRYAAGPLMRAPSMRCTTQAEALYIKAICILEALAAERLLLWYSAASLPLHSLEAFGHRPGARLLASMESISCGNGVAGRKRQRQDKNPRSFPRTCVRPPERSRQPKRAVMPIFRSRGPLQGARGGDVQRAGNGKLDQCPVSVMLLPRV
ncbi:hypothetical protein BD289DRAFT_297232 [Coniella lustricola]|uniref:Uncharacterized protein n=1 Tax=Coniella lustricola TaxID=2025994 RepID=A0A2T3A4N3_9PEZI|nr:hypothetical protein BD289DRAFT_297232 [Coniella lustricola]